MNMRTVRSLLLCAATIAAFALRTQGQEAVVATPDSISAESVPKIPTSVAEAAGRYGFSRSANFLDWDPARREMLISTRFADTPQLHLVKMPGGSRQQITFFADAVTSAKFHPNGGNYILFMKDIGGGEWFQLYRYDVKTGDVTLLTDGKSRNLPGPWSYGGNRIAYMSTRRTGEGHGPLSSR